jgi:chemotaxis protein methyltransferase CheR
VSGSPNTALRLADIEWKLLADLIESRLGLVFDENRRGILEARLSSRLDQLHLDNFHEYYHYLVFHPDRDRELVEVAKRVTNGETYFFRESYQFDLLADTVVPWVRENVKDRPMRILSAGCSSGQEAYSLAMSLHQPGVMLPARGFEIDACDINPLRLAWAREAVYGEASMRACDEETRVRHFVQEDGKYVPRQLYRQNVRFFEANLAQERGERWKRYDAIFCRNVLIYFSEPALLNAVELFRRVLVPEGFLFLGHSESLINKETGFQPVCLDGRIIYRREETEPSFGSS